MTLSFLLTAIGTEEGAGRGGPAYLRALQRLGETITGNSGGLREVFRGLSASDQAALRRRLGAALDELLALGEEGDPELFYAGLLNLGGRAARDGDSVLSGAIFQGLAEGPAEIRGSMPAALGRRALEEFNAMRGTGSAGRRFEYLARHFAREASDPGMLLGMGVAGTVFSATRLGVLSRLAARPAAWWTRGFGAGMAANAAAFPAEVLAFWGTTRAYGLAVRPETLRWDRASIGHELAGLGITLGCLKLFGAASGRLFDRVHGIDSVTGAAARLPAFTRFSRTAFQQLGTLGGIAAGHYAEMRLGLRPQVSGDVFWTDALVTLLQFHVGGRLSHEVLGPRYAAMMQEMALRTRRLELPRAATGRNPLPPFGGALAMAVPEGMAAPRPVREGPSREHILEMSIRNPDEKGGPGPTYPTAVRGGSGTPERAPLDAPFKALINALYNEELSPSERYRLSQELHQDLPLAREVFLRMRRTGQIPQDRTSHEAPPDLDAVLHRINLKHFEEVSDRMHDWQARFQFLQRELRERVNQGTKSRRRLMRRLLESVQLKLLETRRYHHDAESYLGDVKGPSRKSVFSPQRYEKLLHRYNDIHERLGRYIEAKPELAKLLQRYQSVVPSRGASPKVEPEALEAELRRSPLSAERQDLFRKAMGEGDFLLGQYDGFSVGLWLRDLNAGGNSRRSRRGWRALGEYLEAVEEVRNLLGADAFHEWQMAHEKLMLAESADRTAGPLLQQILLAKTSEGTSALVGRFIAAVPPVAESLARFRPVLRASAALKWPEMRTQLIRLAERQYLTHETVRGLLAWLDPAANGGDRQVIYAIREEAVAGLIDFVCKGSHTQEHRQEISRFLHEVVARRDLRMFSVLAITFQNYQLGMMRDRLQVRNQPSKDLLTDRMAIESYDRFREAILATGRFYLENREVLGPYFEVFEKMEYGREDENAQLAAPILQRTRSLLGQGYSVELLNRGGLGQALLLARRAGEAELTISLSSVLDPMEGRAHLDNWLNRAEREFLHAGKYQNGQGGDHPLVLDLQIPRIRSGVSKRDLSLWARDYLETHPMIREVRLAIPARGSEAADPFDSADFRVEMVNRAMPSTEALIANRELDLERNPNDVAGRLELYRMRQEWGQALEERASELRNHLANPRWAEFFVERIQEAQGALDRAREAEQRIVGEASGAESGVVNISDVLRSIEHAHARLAKYIGLRDLAVQITQLRERNWELLYETARLFPNDAGVRSLVQRSVLVLFQQVEKFGGTALTEDFPARRLPAERYDLAWRRRTFLQVAEMVLGRPFDADRLPGLFDLRSVGHSIRDLRWGFDDRGLVLQGDIVPDAALVPYEAQGPEAVRRTEVPGEPDSGSFSFHLGRDRRRGTLLAHFDHLTLPPHLRGRNVGSTFFRELVRMARGLEIPTLLTPDASGDHRYTVAAFGTTFRRPEDRDRVLSRFRIFLFDYMSKLPEFENYDFSALERIRTPRDLAQAHLDPALRRLSLDLWEPVAGEDLPDYYRVGRLFLLNEAPSYDGIFDLRDQSYSMRVFDEYLARRLGRGYFSPPEEN
ncbi:MAG: hypothetical protein IT572_07670 [Deltaproteobacteria bacterium]|nr:hypothetical protein [Deltaproteobacteria bacterium]